MKVNSGHSTKLQSYRQCLLVLLFTMAGFCGKAQFVLHVKSVDKDSAVLHQLSLTRKFSSKDKCLDYLEKMPELLARKGYATASIDSVWVDSSAATALLYLGEQFFWGQLRINGMSKEEIQQTGLLLPDKPGQAFSQAAVDKWQKTLLVYYANKGYPFATVSLDSVELQNQLIQGILEVKKGLYYRIDSIRVSGKAQISEAFLHRYLDLPRGSAYHLKSFESISPRLRELPYLQEVKPWAMRFGGNGAILDLYLEPRKSSQVNVLIGLLPTTDLDGKNKFQVTGEANLHLQNALGAGELISLDWQQLQVKSPRLNLAYQQPYLFGSAFGISGQFDLFKKDSSFLTINGLLGMQYAFSARQNGKIFLQIFKSNLVSVDTQRVVNTKQLPPDMDMSIFNLGVDYSLNTTNYQRNPRRGWDLYASTMAGTRKIRPNNAIVDIKNPDFNYASLYDTVDLNSYQFKIRGRVGKFFPVLRQATLLWRASFGWVQSPSLYRNELFQIGGYKLMRGFDEESIYSSRFLVNTLEYRYLIGINSYFFLFGDYGFTSNKSNYAQSSNRLLGLGFGMAFETAAGFFNLALAAGKTNETQLNLRQTKIHLGYVNYF